MKIHIEQFLNISKEIPIIDVRTPAEYQQGHIPGAFNIPLFSNDERAVIGTIYKQQGHDPAVEKGLEYVGPKLLSFVQKAKEISPDKEVLVHCWRGGMRSGSFAWLLSTSGFKVKTLDGGYKAYRRFIREQFLKAEKLIVLSGMTGSGKTEILYELEKLGEQIIDLEGYANHMGSAFGFIGQDEQPTTEQFENDTAKQWLKLDMKKRIWIEDESRKIGRVVINESLFSKMREASVLKIEIPTKDRINRLVKYYTVVEPQELIEVVNKIEKRLGNLKCQEAIHLIREKNYYSATEILLSYYDKGYEHGLSKRNPETISNIKINSGSPTIAAEILQKFGNISLLY